MTYGERIRAKRKEKQMSLRDLAKKADIDFTFLSRLENDYVTLTVPHAKRLARVLGCSLSELVE